MGLIEDAKSLAQTITSDLNDFAVNVVFTSPTSQTANIKAIAVDHSNTFDELGNPITGAMVVITVSEQLLINEGYTTRNAKNQANLNGHFVVINYADGKSINHRIYDCRPDYTINLFTLFLEVVNG